ncbi:MAG: hypothetical protein F4089_13930, partial [Gammaproteobacteria bacterium]|nr:hypothetical protein [Gammaproteobacteria bacterium]
MIPVTTLSTNAVEDQRASLPWGAQKWRRELRDAVTNVGELLRLVDLDPMAFDGVGGPRQPADFPLRVPRPYIDRMRRRDPGDPLLRQVLPTTHETDTVPG